jgi:hypothetical protein
MLKEDDVMNVRGEGVIKVEIAVYGRCFISSVKAAAEKRFKEDILDVIQ